MYEYVVCMYVVANQDLQADSFLIKICQPLAQMNAYVFRRLGVDSIPPLALVDDGMLHNHSVHTYALCKWTDTPCAVSSASYRFGYGIHLTTR